jgi:hypothetical protein
LDSTQLRTLSEQRRRLITDLLEQAQAHATDAGLRLTATVLSEVEATLQAALVDLAGALTIRNGRLVRPLSHSGFGPRPRSTVPQMRSTADLRPVEVPTEARVEIEGHAIEDELAARRRRTLPDRTVIELVEVTDRSVVDDDSTPAPDSESGAHRELRRAEQELAASEAVHWQAEFELADAEGAVEAAEDRLSSLDTQRIEARRDKVTAERYLAEAKSRQRDAVNTLAEARRRLDAARTLADSDE